MDRAGDEAVAAVDRRHLPAPARRRRRSVPLASGVHAQGLRDALRARRGGCGELSAQAHACFSSAASGATTRRETSAPASAGMRQNSSALDAEIIDTMIQAGWKSAAVIVVAPRSRSVSSTSAAPIATPTEIDSCWLTATSEVARLI